VRYDEASYIQVFDSEVSIGESLQTFDKHAHDSQNEEVDILLCSRNEHLVESEASLPDIQALVVAILVVLDSGKLRNTQVKLFEVECCPHADTCHGVKYLLANIAILFIKSVSKVQRHDVCIVVRNLHERSVSGSERCCCDILQFFRFDYCAKSIETCYVQVEKLE
jgi:hypothetical protein